jgi:hypothetical protein
MMRGGRSGIGVCVKAGNERVVEWMKRAQEGVGEVLEGRVGL